MNLKKIVEGKTKILVPEIFEKKGPLSKAPIFFNPTMEFNRDISIIVISSLKYELKSIIDGLAGTGIRGLRIENEIGNFDITINDANPKAYKIIKKNIALNNLDAKAENKKFNALLSENRYDYVDIDPYGTPVLYIDCAILARPKVIGMTATDTATLCGVYPKTCIRRYFAKSLKTIYKHEIGMRILLGFCAKTAAKYDFSIKPLLVHSSDHYFRIYIKLEKGAKKADLCLENIGYIYHNFKNGERKITREFSREVAGPLWIGKLFDIDFLNSLEIFDWLGTKKRIEKFMKYWVEEINSPPLFYTVNEIAKLAKVSPPKISRVCEVLKENGFIASRTHFDDNGFKTDAGIDEIKEIFRKVR